MADTGDDGPSPSQISVSVTDPVLRHGESVSMTVNLVRPCPPRVGAILTEGGQNWAHTNIRQV